MPNWCTNYLKIDKEVADKYILNDENVDFNKMIPMPESFENTDSHIRANDIYCYLSDYGKNSIADDIKDHYKDMFGSWRNDIETMEDQYNDFCKQNKYFTIDWSKGIPKSTEITREEALKSSYDRGKRNCENYDTYGVPDWYSWRYKNWGVKWNAHTIGVDDYDKDLYEIIFDTPWGPPDTWMETLAEKSDFKSEYEIEGGYEARGNIVAKNGKVTYEELEPYTWEEDDYDYIDECSPFIIIDFNKAKESGLIINPFFTV